VRLHSPEYFLSHDRLVAVDDYSTTGFRIEALPERQQLGGMP
jgi:hypothetical protein